MDTTENEWHSLRREIDALRSENRLLYNEITNLNKILFAEITSLRKQSVTLFTELATYQAIIENAINFSNSKNLRLHLTRLAGMQTAEFIVEHMNKIKTFDTREEHLKYALNQADNDSSGEGLFLEFGVFNGKSINIISATKPNKIIYGFDSFEGLPENWRAGFAKGRFNREGNLPQVNENVRLVKGWFNETIPEFVKEHPEPCAFIHIDCDLYSSTKTVFDTLKNKICAGTVISFDEYYNYPGWQDDGEYKAFNDFVAENNFEFEYIARSNLGQASVRIK